MKKVLLLFMVFLSLPGLAKIHHQYTFNFSNPLSLIPSISINAEEPSLLVSDYIFSTPDSKVNLKFIKSNLGGGLGAYIELREINNVATFNLNMSRGVQMIIKGNKVELDSLVFSSDSYIGGLKLISPTNVGITSPFMNWFGNGAENVNELIYVQNGHAPMIYNFTVYYSSPQNILEAVSPLVKDTIKTTSFNHLILKYPKKVKLSSNPSFTLTSKEIGFSSPQLKANVNNQDSTEVLVSLANDSAIEEIGDYSLIIGENSIITNDTIGYFNPKTVYHIQVVESYAKFNMISVDPDTTSLNSLNEIHNNIIISFPDILRFRENPCNEIIRLVDHDGATIRRMKASYADNSYKSIQLTFQDGQISPVTEKGIYHLTIPERLIWNNEYEPEKPDSGIVNGARFNPEINLSWNVGGIHYLTEESIITTQYLLDNYQGIGYPKSDSEKRIALQNLIDNKVGTEEQLKRAISEFYLDTDVQLPERDKWYIISSFSSDSTQLYLTYDSLKISLTDDIKNAGRFKSICEDTLYMQTENGKFLHLPLSATVDGLYEGTSSKNLTTQLDSVVNELTLAHFAVEGVDSLQSFGLFSLYGCMGKKGSDYVHAYALMNNETKAVMTNPEFGLQYFTETLTNAFRLEEVEAPLPHVNFVFTPDSSSTIVDLRILNVTFPDLVSVSLVPGSVVNLELISDSVQNTIVTDNIVAVSNKSNSFDIVFDLVDNGSYRLIIPEGTFTYDINGTITKVPEIEYFLTNQNTDFVYDLFNKYRFYWSDNMPPAGESYIRDVDLNDCILFTLEKDFVFGVDNSKKVEIRGVYGRKTVAVGTLQPEPSFHYSNFPYCTALRIVLEKPIELGQLPPDTYLIILHPGTIGDNNFAKYLSDNNSISKAECHVNALQYRFADVDNEKVAGITRITDANGEDKVYDLTGRRMTGDVKAGIYIVNGRKVVVR